MLHNVLAINSCVSLIDSMSAMKINNMIATGSHLEGLCSIEFELIITDKVG